MTDKRKKILLMIGCGVACLALLLAISSQFYTPDSSKDQAISDQSGGKSLQIDIPAGELSGNGTEDSAAALPDQTDLPEQSIQADPVKPEVAPEQLTDPTQKPDGEKVDGTPEATDHNNVAKPEATAPVPPDKPQGGETKDGMIYVPGFGWIKDEGGGSTGTEVDGDGDINKPVGDM